ncbi:3-oxoacyl-[acyl-carrier-protein] synthase 2 [Enhygromyxa salina]|uniref:3-oxoacyl-[acyl-carrier-protein] synthase 2 n=1 Tax=Enhygromyxa salina TaxID=215803 RepID=A0A2S9YF89_9BACT|nr:beta-ketoacyl-ACP synthase [Enhygromyxa salina]PRQ03686.1 3-oxoacyl-[acyl-carrier-protein] synthase 2 [Enhygromyxa salina]
MPPGIPITAYSACNGLGQTTAEVLDGLFAGRRGLSEAKPWLGVSTWVGEVPGELPALDPALRGFESRQARISQLVTVPLIPALERAKRRWGAGRIGLILGTSTAGIAESERAWVHHRDHGELPPNFVIERQHALYATVEVIRALTGLRGPGYVVSTACSSSGKVFASARRLLAAGIVDAVLVGGVDSLCKMTVRGFASLEVLSPDPCRPFSSERRGINIGEGAALLLLERPGPGVEGLGVELLGVGESSDAHHMTAPHPEGLGARAAMERALSDAGVAPEEVDQVNVHGTGTTMNDETESKAIRQLFPDRAGLSVVATKGYTGHMLGAAGATEAVFVAATIERAELPASVGVAPLDPTLEVSVELERRTRATRRVLSNSLAFGGSNVSVLLGASE